MISDNDINRLYDESIVAGDNEMAALCVLAVFGPNIAGVWCKDRGVTHLFTWTQDQARDECARVITENQANHKELP